MHELLTVLACLATIAYVHEFTESLYAHRQSLLMIPIVIVLTFLLLKEVSLIAVGVTGYLTFILEVDMRR